MRLGCRTDPEACGVRERAERARREQLVARSPQHPCVLAGAERADQRRLADAGLAGDQHHAPAGAAASASNNHSRSSRGALTRATLSESLLRDVAQLLGLSQRLQLLQRLVLDLADPLARHVERAADLVQRARVLAAEA